MKKIKLSLVAMLATSTMIMAGGDIAPVEAEVVVIPTTKDFYIGFNTELAKDTVWFSDSTIGVQAGWTFFRAGAFDTAVEARYTTNISDAFDTYSYGAFIKPGYSFDVVKAYGLVGYSDSNDNDFSDLNFLTAAIMSTA